jgi:hypothetical protein
MGICRPGLYFLSYLSAIRFPQNHSLPA